MDQPRTILEAIRLPQQHCVGHSSSRIGVAMVAAWDNVEDLTIQATYVVGMNMDCTMLPEEI